MKVCIPLLLCFSLSACSDGKLDFKGGKKYVISYKGVEPSDSIKFLDSLAIELDLESIQSGLPDSSKTSLGPVIHNSIEFP
ncbi:MAG: hypothetical protein AAGD28_16990 [Bacteroidota bacterium]